MVWHVEADDGAVLYSERGDEAVIVGVQDEQAIPMHEIADLAGTINYEMACAFGMRLPRTYV